MKNKIRYFVHFTPNGSSFQKQMTIGITQLWHEYSRAHSSNTVHLHH